MPILTVKNLVNDRILHKPSKKVKDFNSTEILILIQEMRRIAIEPNVVGIAAPQLGKHYRVFALCTNLIPQPVFFFNPVLKGVSEEMKEVTEGCLSVPGKVMSLERYAKVTLAWQDERCRKYSKDNKPYEFDFEGFEGQAVQHEMNHIDGILCSDIAKATFNASDFEESFAKAKAAEEAEALAIEG